MRTLLFFCSLFMVAYTCARPVSYPTGITLMQRNNGDRNSVHVHYSPTAHYSVGYLGEYWRDQEWQLHALQFNYLAKRWNAPASQANLYFKSGIGLAYSDKDPFDNHSQAAAFAGVAVDKENRRFFGSYENRFYYANDIDKFFMQSVRVGVAPYLGDYGDFHTWIMWQVDHRPTQTDPLVNTALLRFFKNEYLAEIGVSDDNHLLVNFIARF